MFSQLLHKDCGVSFPYSSGIHPSKPHFLSLFFKPLEESLHFIVCIYAHLCLDDLYRAGNINNIIRCKRIPESYHHCSSGIEAAQIFGGQVVKNIYLSEVVGIVGTSNGHLKQRVCIYIEERSCPSQNVQYWL